MPAPFAHSGRGGAGNFFSPAKAPKPSEPDPADVISSSDLRPSLQGRGGIGNFEAAKTPARIVEERGQSVFSDSEAARNADEQVKPPERAFLGNRRPTERDGP